MELSSFFQIDLTKGTLSFSGLKGFNGGEFWSKNNESTGCIKTDDWDLINKLILIQFDRIKCQVSATNLALVATLFRFLKIKKDLFFALAMIKRLL